MLVSYKNMVNGTLFHVASLKTWYGTVPKSWATPDIYVTIVIQHWHAIERVIGENSGAEPIQKLAI